MREPRFWSAGLDPKSREAAPLTRLFLSPLAWLYASVTARRIRLANPLRLDARVICVGNITAGGTGKSPIVIYIRDYFANHLGCHAASLSRGYGGKCKGPLQVRLDNHRSDHVGDEPVMLAMSGDSWIGADRAAAGQAMQADGVEIIVMDDGHQNPSLAKDLSLVVIDSQTGFGNGHVIPKGPLREPVAQGLARADAIILMGTGPVPPAVTQLQKPVLRAHLVARHPPPKGALVAFAGIGRPEKFFDTLTALGARVEDAVPFPDHHRFSDKDLHYLHRLAGDHNAQLVTTDKDYARLSPAQRAGILTFPVEIQFETPDSFHTLLTRVTTDRQE